MVSNIFYFHPYLGKWSNLTNRVETTNQKLPGVPHVFFFFVCSSVCFFAPKMASIWAIDFTKSDPKLRLHRLGWSVMWSIKHVNVTDSAFITQGCRCVPYTCSESIRHKWYQAGSNILVFHQGLAAWFRAKSTTLSPLSNLLISIGILRSPPKKFS